VTYSTVENAPALRGFVGAPGPAGVIGEFRLPANRFQIKRIDTPTVTAAIVELERDFPVSGNWVAPDVHYFDMSFIPRPPASRGCFEDVFSPPQTYGKIFVVPAGHRLHGEGAIGPQHSLNVFVSAHPLFHDEPGLGAGLEPLLRDCLRFKSDAVLQILERIAAEVMQPRFASELFVEGLGITLLGEAGRTLQSRAQSRVRKGGLPLWRLNRIEDRVRTGEIPSIAELAQLCGLSRRQLNRAFREETGRTVSAYVQAFTIERAKLLLVNSDRPVSALAAEVGFKSAAAFANAFRSATGETPSAFRATRRSDGSFAVMPRPFGR